MVCCARWLGVQCLETLLRRKDVEVIGVAVPERGWWSDVNDMQVVQGHGLKYVPFKDIAKFIAEQKPDFVLSVLTDYIFKDADLENATVVNVHPAPLPRYRGCNSYSHAIMNGDDTYGTSIHYVNNKIDEGDIIDVSEFSIDESWTVKQLYDFAQAIAFAQFIKHISVILAGVRAGKRVKVKPQDGSQAQYYNRNSLKALKALNSDYYMEKEQFDQLFRQARALDFPPFEPLHITDGKRKIYLTTEWRK